MPKHFQADEYAVAELSHTPSQSLAANRETSIAAPPVVFTDVGAAAHAGGMGTNNSSPGTPAVSTTQRRAPYESAGIVKSHSPAVQPSPLRGFQPSSSAPSSPQHTLGRPALGGGLSRSQSPGAAAIAPIASAEAVQRHRWASVMLCSVSFLCLLMACAQLGTNVFTKDGTLNQVSQTLWSRRHCPTSAIDSPLCSDTSLPAGSCDATSHRVRSIQAFSLFSFFAAVVTAGASAIFLFSTTIQIPENTPLLGMLVQWLCTIITWSLMASTYHAKLCDTTSMSARGYRMSASFALSLCTWIATFLASGCFVFLRFIRV